MATEMSCVWMRRILLRSNALPLHKSPSQSLKQSPPLLIPLVSSHRLSFTTATACSLPDTLASVDDGPSGFDVPPFNSPNNFTRNSNKSSKLLLKGMRYDELEKWVQSQGYRPGQAMMLWKRLYGNDVWAHHSDQLEGLNKGFRKMLSENAEFKALSLEQIITAADGTRKILFTLEDGMVIETVVIPSDSSRNTVCVSSQVGCGMNCQFCYTGRMGLRRNLTAAEIVEQAVFARSLLTSEVGDITNVVFMGMGEPLHNIDNVIKAADIMVDDQGLHFSPRKITVSTSGLVPQLRRYLRESNCALAVSLNATTDEVRNWIMPINRKYNIGLLLQTLREEIRFKNNYKVLFEYVMLAGVNDSIEDARRLADLVQGIPCKINLITFNPHSGSHFRPTSDEKMVEFRNYLAGAGRVVFMRPSRGDDQMAACGQLGKPGEIQAPILRVPEKFKTATQVVV
ncbi:uncharacterized protein LOC126789975 [Argentina anserina]|uniref:uncharacterized protein LOC126789975 n=1 Tax=Argentina anserina TaxID=57926 RepID=UPI0021765139|nr:uncharacterized protein LOC126789975 [Potentilla anserina]